MTAIGTIKRYSLFLLGIFINSLGISFITKASLGTSPISSIPYVMSLEFSPSFGLFTFLFNMLMIAGEILLLRRRFQKIQFLQIPITILFSYFIDFTMKLLNWMQPEHYAVQVLFLLVGCAILALGVTLEVLADVVMLPGEGIVNAISITFHKEFGYVKVMYDTTLMVAAVVLSLLFSHGLNGIREGSVISALLVGFIVRFYSRRLFFLKGWFQDESFNDRLE